MLVTLMVFHFDKSGNDFNDVQSSKIQAISSVLSIFHFDISGNHFNLEHS